MQIIDIIKNIKDVLDVVQDYYNDYDDILDVQIFKQVWPTTSLGFDDRAGSSMLTIAPTTIITYFDDNGMKMVDVWFGCELAYTKPYTRAIDEDINKRQLASVGDSAKYDLNKF